MNGPRDFTVEKMAELSAAAPEIQNDAIARYVEETRKEFVKYLRSESGTTVAVKSFNTDAVVDALRELEASGFRVNSHDDDGAVTQVFIHPNLYHDLRDNLEWGMQPDDIDGAVTVYGAECHMAPELDEEIAIAIHPEATCPNHPRAVEKPYLVRHPDGVVTVVVR